MTTWKQFTDQIEDEAQQEGQEAVDELETLRRYFGKQREAIKETCHDQPCLMDAFLKDQQKLPPSLRSVGAMLYCPCRRCNPARW